MKKSSTVYNSQTRQKRKKSPKTTSYLSQSGVYYSCRSASTADPQKYPAVLATRTIFQPPSENSRLQQAYHNITTTKSNQIQKQTTDPSILLTWPFLPTSYCLLRSPWNHFFFFFFILRVLSISSPSHSTHSHSRWEKSYTHNLYCRYEWEHANPSVLTSGINYLPLHVVQWHNIFFFIVRDGTFKI